MDGEEEGEKERDAGTEGGGGGGGGGDEERMIKRMDGWEKCGICEVRDELNWLVSNALKTRGGEAERCYGR